MAVREQPVGMQGGIRSWVTMVDVRAIAAEIAELHTPDDLVAWADIVAGGRAGPYLSDIYYRARLGELPAGRRLTDDERADLLPRALIAVAIERQREALWTYVRERGLNAHVALGQAGDDRSLVRCTTCNAPMISGGFYCDQHTDDQAAEVAGLLQEAT